MSPEERQLLSSLFDRVKAAAATPRDADAEAFITQSVRDNPTAPYLLAQAVIIQEQGMKAAADRIKQLEDQVKDLQENADRPAPASQGGGSFLGGLGSIFGSSTPPAPQRPAPSQQGYGQQQGYAPQQQGYSQPQPGPWGQSQQQQPTGPWSQQPQAQSSGGGFLRGALGTAAGVAGGVMLAESLSSLFSPHIGGAAAGLGGLGAAAAAPAAAATPAVEETVVNNYYGDTNNNDNGGGKDDNSNDQNLVSDDSDNDFDNSYDDGGDDSFNV
ncbi:DUF2076 domain-containing protein [Rhizobium sp. HT1-10]|uniref:DUF2076 domain-containing protein n=1 Tax=Rhizobium sp. HT1-10 TaxID=3111638 RepID=UPI003C19741E